MQHESAEWSRERTDRLILEENGYGVRLSGALYAADYSRERIVLEGVLNSSGTALTYN